MDGKLVLDASVAEELRALLEDESSNVRSAACEVMMKLPSNELTQFLPVLVKLLADETPVVRSAACSALALFPVELLADHREKLALLLRDAHPMVRKVSCRVLSKLPAQALTPHASRLASLLADAKDDVRRSACLATAKLPESELKAYSSNLVDLLEDSDANVRMAACTALFRLPAESLVPHAKKLSTALLNMPNRMTEKLSWLGDWLQHDDFEVKEAACNIMAGWSSEAILPFSNKVTQLLEVEGLGWLACTLLAKLPVAVLTPHVKKLAEQLRGLPPQVADQFVSLADLITHEEPAVREAMCRIMSRWSSSLLGHYAGHLAHLLEDKSAFVWRAACDVLAKTLDLEDSLESARVIFVCIKVGRWLGLVAPKLGGWRAPYLYCMHTNKHLHTHTYIITAQ